MSQDARRVDPSVVPGAKPAPSPGFIEPCHPTLREKAPSGGRWIHEIKFDGYRTQAHLRNGQPAIYTRRGYDWTLRFQPIADALATLPANDLILDGEAVVADSRGVPDFGLLHADLAAGRKDRLLYYAFDLLYLDGFDLRGAPLAERKRVLAELLAGASERILYAEHLEGDGAEIHERACAMGLEGIVSKQQDAPYRSGRVESWIKVKCGKRDAFPIVAFVEKLGAKPRKIASFYVGRREGDRLLYAGKVRSGFTEAEARDLRERLDPFIRKDSPLSEPVKKPKATWVEPVIEAEVAYSTLTENNLLREAVFKGVREDQQSPAAPASLRRPSRAESSRPSDRRAAREHPAAACRMPCRHRKRNSPPTGRRSGSGRFRISGAGRSSSCATSEARPSITRASCRLSRRQFTGSRSKSAKAAKARGSGSMTSPACSAWSRSARSSCTRGTRRIDDIEHPDMLVFDLDPGEGVAWEFVIETALRLRRMLKDEGLEPWPKLTGGKGLHLMAPLEPKIDHDQARAYAKQIAQRLAATAPDRYTISSAPEKRAGRIFIDYLRNGRGTTAIGAWSPRARPGFPIAAPVSWRQVENGIRPDAFTMEKPPRR